MTMMFYEDIHKYLRYLSSAQVSRQQDHNQPLEGDGECQKNPTRKKKLNQTQPKTPKNPKLNIINGN